MLNSVKVTFATLCIITLLKVLLMSILLVMDFVINYTERLINQILHGMNSSAHVVKMRRVVEFRLK